MLIPIITCHKRKIMVFAWDFFFLLLKMSMVIKVKDVVSVTCYCLYFLFCSTWFNPLPWIRLPPHFLSNLYYKEHTCGKTVPWNLVPHLSLNLNRKTLVKFNFRSIFCIVLFFVFFSHIFVSNLMKKTTKKLIFLICSRPKGVFAIPAC